MLNAFGQVLSQLEIDFFLVGALARDIRLSVDPAFASKRVTKDVDIAILLASEEQFYQVKDALLATGDFTAHERETIKLFYKQAVEVDLLPFGEIENHTRETRIEKPRPFILDVPGFKEVMPDAEQLTVEGLSIRVCSLEGIVLLKIIANANNPSRTLAFPTYILLS
jgi:predicted nucleotidyltransferase